MYRFQRVLHLGWGMARPGNTRKSMTTFLLDDLESIVRKKKTEKRGEGGMLQYTYY
jgi:hypothetical protein